VFIGMVGIHPTPEYKRAELGYWMGHEYRGQGYMSEAVRRMIQFGFEVLDLNRVYAACFAENKASEHVMQKAGMVYEGRMRQHYIRFDKVHDAVYYGILREDWRE
jgi:[ribosomal protein S5]-alanine N-acetyltransferase